jgi:hypothetical protein
VVDDLVHDLIVGVDTLFRGLGPREVSCAATTGSLGRTHATAGHHSTGLAGCVVVTCRSELKERQP